nr:hypothetical protein [Chromobacterium sp. ASV5]
MNEISDAAQLTRDQARLVPERGQYAILLLTDCERLANAVAPQAEHVPTLLQTAARQGCLLESLLPDIRALALLLAARRQGAGPTPSRLADAADWLAARILLLDLSHVAVHLADFNLLDEANRRIAAWSEELARPLKPALPVLLTRAPAADRGWWLQGWSRQAPPSVSGGDLASALAASRTRATHCRQRLHRLCGGALA